LPALSCLTPPGEPSLYLSAQLECEENAGKCGDTILISYAIARTVMPLVIR